MIKGARARVGSSEILLRYIFKQTIVRAKNVASEAPEVFLSGRLPLLLSTAQTPRPYAWPYYGVCSDFVSTFARKIGDGRGMRRSGRQASDQCGVFM